ncbi:phage GP46 family protein [Salmonella enterica]|nr:phage GP46 family protein [Salmonella enterica]EKF5234075.1 phage GP46 family protein [Salmonella enterica]
MDRQLSPDTGDYTGSRTQTLENAAYLRLKTPLGSWWAAPSLGSRLHELEREKDRQRVYVLARQYAQQALQPLTDDDRATSVTVTSTRYKSGWLYLHVEIMTAAGEKVVFKHPVKVI